jgi:hypothetical protein
MASARTTGIGFDVGTTRRGMLLAAAGAALGTFALWPEEAAAAKTSVAQTGWRFCQKCRGLVRGSGACPAGGKHKPRRDINYVLYATVGSTPGTWVPWFRCVKCAVLFLGGTNTSESGVCAKGGKHDPRGGVEFALWGGETVPVVMDSAWDLCNKCFGLFNYAGNEVGFCPVDALGHAHDPPLNVKIVILY